MIILVLPFAASSTFHVLLKSTWLSGVFVRDGYGFGVKAEPGMGVFSTLTMLTHVEGALTINYLAIINIFLC